MKLRYLILLIFILNIILVSAEEFNLKRNIPLTYKGLEIKLLAVGNEGTIRLQIQSQEKLIQKNKEIILYDVKFKNLEPNYVLQTAKIGLELIAECLVDKDCELKPCASSFCNYRKCEFTKTPGCVFEKECKPIGSFEEINNILSYCSTENVWKQRKSYKEECEYNYECLSNLCNGFCSTHIFGGKKMAPAWILILIGSLLLIDALFILFKTKIAKRIIRNIALNFPDKTWRILAIIELIIALVLIIWTLV